MPQWHLQHGESYLVTGEPVIVADLNSSITHSIELLLVAVLLVMAGDPGADLLRAPAAAAAGRCGARRGAHLRRPVARGGIADDGLDRRAAGAGGAGGGLRDPVPVAGGGGLRAGGGSGPAEGPGRLSAPTVWRSSRARRRSAAPRSPPPPRPAPPRSSCWCCRRCRWCAASACCSWWGSAIALLCALTVGAAALALARARLLRPGHAPVQASRRRAPAGRLAGGA